MKNFFKDCARRLWRAEMRLRRWFYSFDTPLRNRLYERKRRVARREVLSAADRRELELVNVKLGNFPRRFKLSPADIAARQKYADALIADIIARRRSADESSGS